MKIANTRAKRGRKKANSLNIPPEEVRDMVKKEIQDLKVLEGQYAQLKLEDPFWFYEPSDGVLSDEGLGILNEFLKKEDIPQRMGSQRDVHESKADIIGHFGGNQGGKTTLGAIEAFIAVTKEVPYAMRAWYPVKKLPRKPITRVRVVGEDYVNGILLNIIPTYKKWVPRDYLVKGKWEYSYSAEKRVLTLVKDGHPDNIIGTIEFMSNQQDVSSFQGTQVDMVIYDEEPRKDIYKENLMRFTTSERLRVLFCMTPTKGMTWVYDLIHQERDNSEWFKVPSVTNGRANFGVLKKILSEMGSYEEIKMRLLGEFVSLAGLVYGNLIDRKIHLVEPFDIRCTCGRSLNHTDECPYSHYLVLRGIDPHLVKPTACVWMAIDREDNCYIVDCYLGGSDTDMVKGDIAAMSEGMRLGWAAMDRSADSDIKAFDGRNILKELTRGKNGLGAVRKSEKYDGSIKAGVDVIKKHLKINKDTQKPRLFFFNTAEVKPLVLDIMTLERDTYHNEETRGVRDKIREGKHDLHAALRYIFQFPICWYPIVSKSPQPVFADEEACW